MKEKRLPTLGEVIFVLVSFTAIMFLFVVQFGIPIQLALLTTWFVIMLVGLRIGYTYMEMQKGILKGINDGLEAVLVLICVGALLGSIWAFLFQDVAMLDAFNSLYTGISIDSGVDFIDNLLNRGGIVFMLDVIALILFALGVGGLMEKIGILQVICNKMLAWADNAGKTTLSTIVSGFFGNFFGGAAYVSLITASKITEKNYDRLHIDRRVLSRNTESGGTITTPMVPWSDGGVFMAATLGVSTLTYLPFLWFNFLVIAVTILYGFTNKFIWYTNSNEKESVSERKENSN